MELTIKLYWPKGITSWLPDFGTWSSLMGMGVVGRLLGLDSDRGLFYWFGCYDACDYVWGFIKGDG
jgi:hypothetical protein